MEPRSFTWFPKLTAAVDRVPDEFALEFAKALMAYGTYGIVPEFSEWGLAVAFETVREDIDNSIRARDNGRRGGRPRKHEDETAGKNPCAQNAKVVSDHFESEKGVSDCEKVENPPIRVYQTKPDQTIPTQTKPDGERRPRKRASFTAPTADEVAEFAREDGLSLDAEKFVDYYAAQGWRLSNGNAMRDWRAAARNWARRDRRSRSPSDPFNRGEVSSEYANL